MAHIAPKSPVDEDVFQDGTDSTGLPTGECSIHVLHDGTEHGKKEFLASFTASEDKAIMRKVDLRFLWLIGITYLIKNSKASLLSLSLSLSTNIPPPSAKSCGCRSQ